MITTTFDIPYDFNDAYWVVEYINNTLRPKINFTSARFPWFAGLTRENPDDPDSKLKLIGNKLTFSGVNVSFPFDFYEKQFMSVNYGLGLAYYDFQLTNSDYSDLFDQKDYLLSNLHVNYSYNLPWKNDLYHPVRQFNLSMSYDFASKALGMQNNLDQYKLFSGLNYAPLLHTKYHEFVKTITIQNRTHYRVVDTDNLKQHLPGIDDTEYFQYSGRPLFTRLYLRGFKETMWGKEIVSTQTDIRFKLFDNINFSLNLGVPVLSSQYLGFSIWNDYTKLSRIIDHTDNWKRTTQTKTFKAVGLELQSNWVFFLVPTIVKTGYVYDPDDRKYDKRKVYYIIEIPLISFG